MPYWTTFRRPPLKPASHGVWTDADAAESARLLELYGQELEYRRGTSSDIPPQVRELSLAFYPVDVKLYELLCEPYQDNAPVYVISDGNEHVLLDGSEDAIYRFNALAVLKLDVENVSDYIRFFTSHSILPGGRWLIVESLDDLRWRFEVSTADKIRIKSPLKEIDASLTSKGRLLVKVTGLHDDSLYNFSFSVTQTGKVFRSRGAPVLRHLPVIRDALDDFPGGPDLFNLKTGWEPVDAELNEKIRGYFELTDLRCSWTILAKELAFFPQVRLLRIERHDRLGGFFVYAVWGETVRQSLEGGTWVIHQLFDKEQSQINADNILDYAVFFCSFMNQGDEGKFFIAATSTELNTTARPEGFQSAVPSITEAVPYRSLTPATLLATIDPPEIIAELDDSEGWKIMAHMHYGQQLFLATLSIKVDGTVEMLSDTPVVHSIPPDENKSRVYTMDECRERNLSFRSAKQNIPSSTTAQARVSELAVEKEVLRKFVEQQLIDGLRLLEGQSFVADAKSSDAAVLATFAEYVVESKAAIIFESDIPFCEEIIQKIIVDNVESNIKVETVDPLPYDETTAYQQKVPKSGILTVSFHQISVLRNPERFGYQIATTETTLLIGCAEQSIVPEPLRRVVDLVLPLARMNKNQFASVFAHILGQPIPKKMLTGQDTWCGYVLPEDFYQPLRELKLSQLPGAQPGDTDDDSNRWNVEQAVAYIGKQVADRLHSATAGNAPPLDEVHGLGEAKSVAQDLIADIRDALNGRIDWQQVDRGILLAGPPGTGKTMLARSIARSCGVRFISTSAASWVAGTEHLGQHIRKIHGIFAEARRYAPSILFIDELDTIGSRDNAGDHNAHYVTEIVNTVLQEIQGFKDTVPVFVIGATNHADRIDPALRRAGRLDNTVHIRRPNRNALASIFEYHLNEYCKTGNETGTIDAAQLGAIAWGSTGADVERFVRDAARRARKEGVLLETRHLAAAASGRPRSKHSLQHIDADVLQRTAIHEAGHTVALIASEHYPVRLSMVSIVPRDDGSLGFTGFSGDADQAITRQGFQDYLRSLMGGRAAEELVYGENAVSSGAGGESDGSDLAQATQLAIRLVDRMGMGKPVNLRWKSVPDDDTLSQVRAMLDAAYADALAILRDNKALLDDISNALVEKHEILSTELHAIAKNHGWDIRDKVSGLIEEAD